jgi:hypothetical protein
VFCLKAQSTVPRCESLYLVSCIGWDRNVHVLQMPDPWAQVMGSEAPAVVLYEGGLCLLAGTKSVMVDLHSGPCATVLQQLATMTAGRYSATYCTDQPSYSWIYWAVPGDASTKKVVSVYGDMTGFVAEAGPIPDDYLQGDEAAAK